MQRRDVGLGAATAVVLGLLVANVAMRPTPNRHDVVILLYVVGGVLELVGVSTVAVDLLARRRRIRAYEGEFKVQHTSTSWTRAPRGFTAIPAFVRPGTLEQRVDELERQLRAAREETRRAIEASHRALDESLRAAIRANADRAKIQDRRIAAAIGLGGSDVVQWLGFGALIAGLLVGVAGNLLSAT